MAVGDRKERTLLLLLVAVALLLRAFWFSDYAKADFFPFIKDSDSQEYFLKANDIAAGDFFRKDLNLSWPFYAYFLGFFLKLFSGNLVPVLLLQYLLGAVNGVLIFLIGKKLFNPTVGWIAALLCACYALFVFYESMLMYTSLSVFLTSLFFLVLLELQERLSLKRMLGAGILFGIGNLTQANMLIFGFLAILWVLWHRKESFKKAWIFSAVFFTGFFMVVLPQMARDSVASKALTLGPQNLGVNFYIGNNPEAGGVFVCPSNFTSTQRGIYSDARAIARGTLNRDLKDSEVSGFWVGKALAFMREHPKAYLKLLLQKFENIFSGKEFVMEHEYRYVKDSIRAYRLMLQDLKWVLPFAILGMILSFRAFERHFLLFLAIAAMVLGMLMFVVTEKHRLGIIPFLSIFAGHCILGFWETWKQKRYGLIFLMVVVLSGLYLLCNQDVAASPSHQRGWDAHQVDERLLRVKDDLDHARYHSALIELDLLNRRVPRNRFVVFHQGAAYFLRGDLEEAENKFKEAVRIFPYYVDALYNLGLLYNKEGKYPEAEAMLRRAIFLDPDDVGVAFELGLTLKATGRREEAKAEFQKALGGMNRWRTGDIAMIQKALKELS